MSHFARTLLYTGFFLILHLCVSYSQDNVSSEIEAIKSQQEVNIAFEKSLIKSSVKRIKEIINVVDDNSYAITQYVATGIDNSYKECIRSILDSNLQDIGEFLENIDDHCRPFEKCFISNIEYSSDNKVLFFTISIAAKHKRGKTFCDHYVISFRKDHNDILLITDYSVVPWRNDCQ